MKRVVKMKSISSKQIDVAQFNEEVDFLMSTVIKFLSLVRSTNLQFITDINTALH